MQTSRGILKKKITRKVTLLEIVPWCSLISLGWCWAVSLEESFLKSCTSKLGIIKNSGKSALKNDVNSVTIRLAVGVKNPESTEPNLLYLASIFNSSLLFISTDSCGRASQMIPNDPAPWNKLPGWFPSHEFWFFTIWKGSSEVTVVTSKVRLQKGCGSLPKHALSCFYWLTLRDAAFWPVYGEAYVTRNGSLWPTVSRLKAC